MAKRTGQARFHYLGRQAKSPIKASRLDRIEYRPRDDGSTIVSLVCDEFTSKCPVTEQPDFGQLVITYRPGAYIVETKSLKLYLQGFRDLGGFNEVIAEQIAGDLFDRLAAEWLRVEAHFGARGGIRVNAVITFGTPPGWLDSARTPKQGQDSRSD